jgi:hypothetical protein
MVNDEVTDPVSGRVYVVSWDGSSGPLQTYDTRLTAQRPGAKDRMTSGATMTIDLRARGSIYKGSIQSE